ncbi:MAG: hypothetical protein WAW59_03075 [Patescibacteria group bacterium]
MKLHSIIIGLILCVLGFSAFAVTAVSPSYRIRIWEGSPLSFSDSQYTTGTSSSLGTVKTLKSNPGVISLLSTRNYTQDTGGLDMKRGAGAVLTTITFNGSPHQRLSDIGIPSGECVAFARSMTGTKTTPYWYKGLSLMSYLTWYGVGYKLNTWSPVPLQPGTMIAHFQGLSRYPQTKPYGHVAIFLSWSYNSQGYIDGINVVDQNFVWTVGGNTGSAAGLIQKHKIPLSSGTTTKTYNASEYHVVDVR